MKVVTGEGELVTGGSKVVKNAAGFDFPKLMVGSLGQLGVLVELTFKVFPAPQASATLSAEFPNATAAQQALVRLAMSQLDLACLDYEPPSRLWLQSPAWRAAAAKNPARTRWRGASAQVTTQEDDGVHCASIGEFAWVAAGHSIVKIPLIPSQIAPLEEQLLLLGPNVLRRYSVGGNVAWLAWPPEISFNALAQIGERLGRDPLVIRSHGEPPILRPPAENAFLSRIRSVFDPHRKVLPSQTIRRISVTCSK